MADNSFNNTVESLFKGMDSFITTKTVVGDAIHIGDTIILPLVDVSFGVAAGAFSQEKKNNGAGGMGGKINPSAVLVIQNGESYKTGRAYIRNDICFFGGKNETGMGIYIVLDGNRNADHVFCRWRAAGCSADCWNHACFLSVVFLLIAAQKKNRHTTVLIFAY